MSKVTKRVFLVLCLLILLLVAMFLTMTSGLKKAVSISVGSVDLSGMADGTYTGQYTFKRWRNTVQVEVIDRHIVAITVLKDVRAAKITDCANEIIRRVLNAQDTQVDAVSGATATSKAYLKAIEDALSKSLFKIF